MVLLRVSLDVYSGPRRCKVEEALSDAICLSCSILAGCGFATSWLKVLMFRSLQAFGERYKCIMLYAFVDDITIVCIGTQRWLLRITAEGLAYLIALLQGLGFEINGSKSVIVVREKRTGRWIADRIKSTTGQELQAKKHNRNLGVDSTVGQQRRVKVIKDTMNKQKRRLGRVKCLRRRGGKASKVGRLGLQPALTYGATVLGRSDTQLHQIRATVGATMFTDTARRSLTLSFLLENGRQDPAHMLIRLPLLEWAKAVWTKRVPLRILDGALARAQAVQQQRSHPWASVVGPGGAVVATLRRIGWQATSAAMWTTHDGTVLDLADDISPRSLQSLIAKAVERWQYQQVAQHEGLEHLRHGIHIGPIKKVISSLTARQLTKEASGLRSTVIGAQWPQARLFEAGLAACDQCQKCGAAAGTLPHRHGSCVAWAARRRESEIGHVQFPEGHLTAMQEAFWGRCLLPNWFQGPQPKRIWQVEWSVAIPGGVFTTDGFVDGSGKNLTEADEMRIGVGCAAVDHLGHITGACHGPSPGWLQEVGEGELFAVEVILRHALPPFTVYSDYQNLLDGIAAGPCYCCAANNAYAEQWRRIWRLIHDIGTDQVHFREAKAHQVISRLAYGTVERRLALGNRAADEEAKLGAECHPRSWPYEVERFKQQAQTVSKMAGWIGQASAAANTEPRDSTGKQLVTQANRHEELEGKVLARRAKKAVEKKRPF